MIKILLADNHKMFMDGMRAFLEPHENIEIIGEALNGNQVLDFLEKNAADIVVLEITMPELNGIETTKFIRKNYPETKVLILTMHEDKEFIIKSMRYGASGYILKNKTKEELIMAIHNIADGRTHYGLEIMNHAIAASNINENKNIELTSREIEVLQKVAEGFTSKEAAEILSISETTLNTHRRNIMSKLDLPSTIHLVRYAIKNGYVKL